MNREIVRRLNTLNFILENITKKSINKIDPEIYDILLYAIYLYVYKHRPLPIVVNTAVEKTKKINKKACGFVNAILRNLKNYKKSIELVILNDDYLRYSFPEWIVKEVKKTFKKEYKEILKYLNQYPEIHLRTPSHKRDEVAKKLEKYGYLVKKGKLPTSIYLLSNKKNITSSLPWKDGLIYFQDEASQLVALLALELSKDKSILDFCSSPGGKVTLIASENPAFKYYYNDLSERLDLINENIKRLKLKNIYLWDKKQKFHTVIVDAPCSSLGTLRRHPEIKWKKRLEDIKIFFNTQLNILLKASNFTNKYLIYSICTFTKKESIDVINNFLNQKKDFRLIEYEKKIKNKYVKLPNYIWLNGMDIFYIAILEKV